MIPTPEQMLSCIRMCQTLSNFYLDIHLFRYDQQRKEIYIIAGDTINLIIDAQRNWEFDNEP
ncbi:hypothetical protein [Cyanothece sp. BG0011]|uniref:DUF6888 family protein n=1 Tax=Cyanothece sp. BG0011 TaxID=2082950 RepID=UPI000D1DE166|nr:hypothetical protein [Cyanothece sp. BG0011]